MRVEPVLVVAVILLFASSVVVDGVVQAIGHACRPGYGLVQDLIYRPVTYGDTSHSYGVRQPPARSAVLR